LSSNKSFSSEIANRYALALYELAVENSDLELVEKNVNDFFTIYSSSEDLKIFIKNPTQSQSSQLEILEKISSQMNLSKLIINFLKVLVKKRRIFFVNKIFKSFMSLVLKKKGEVQAFLVSSKKLTNEELKNLNQNLTQATGTPIVLDYKVDENLIGGLKIQIGSLMIDTSIKNRLKKYEQIMLEV
jgi:F-type H+-transporting ATPase subunit delta|tara:strand:+ start:277 stop:834 length:558 start_codon:yes stop_codon:yes gene_type:complete